MELANSIQQPQVYVNDCLHFDCKCQEEQMYNQPTASENTALIDNLNKLQEGMLFNQVVDLIGNPDNVECLSEGRWFITYCLPAKSELRIVLGPGLIWARLFVSETEIRVVA